MHQAPTTTTCSECQVERGFGECADCKRIRSMRKVHKHLRVKRDKRTGKSHVLGEHQLDPKDKPVPFQRVFRKVGRNEPCPCGSGKKHKKCCLDKIQADPPRRKPIPGVDEPLRKVTRITEEGDELLPSMGKLREGDHFRLDGGEGDHVDPTAVFVATSDAYKNDDGVWCIDAEPLADVLARAGEADDA